MKKILPVIIFCLATLQMVNAQIHEIEVLGMGVLDDESPVLTYDPADVVKVEVEAIYFHFDPQVAPPVPIDFNGQEVLYNDVDIHSSAGAATNEYNKGYYRATLTSLPVDGKVELDKKGLGNEIVTFYIYVHRNRTGLPYSKLNPENEIAFLHATYPDASVEAKFALEPATGDRKLTVTVPISDNEHKEADDRIGVLKLKSNGTVLDDVEFALNTGLDNFYLQQLEVDNVMPSVDEVTVEIYSPSPRGYGDSFYAGTILLDVEEAPDPGCTFTQGYWKNHVTGKKADPTWYELPSGPRTEFFETDEAYYTVLTTPVKGNAYYILAHQYIAAELNMLSGADDTDAMDAFSKATRFFNAYSPDDELPGYVRDMLIDWAEILDEYNNGIIGPGHCDDGEVEENDDYQPEVQASVEKTNKGKAKGKNKSAFIEHDVFEINEIAVYPNPVRNTATVRFTPVADDRATVDLYNAVGQKVSRLFDRDVFQDVSESFQFDAGSHKEGLYIIRVQNGNRITTARMQVVK